MLHAKPSEAKMARLSNALGKSGGDEPSGSYDSRIGGALSTEAR